MRQYFNRETLVLAAVWLAGSGLAAAQTEAKHPNLFLNRAEIDQVKAKVKQHPWAASLLEQLRERSKKENPNEGGLSAAVVYVLSGDPAYGDFARKRLMGAAHSWLPKYAA